MAGRAPTHGPDGRFIRTLADAERDADACRLRSRGLSYRQIAKQLGYSDHSGARLGVERALAETVAEAAAEIRQLELQKLDNMEQAALAVLERQHVTVDRGAVVYHADEPLLDDAPVLQSIDRLLKIQERRAKLLGLDAPKRLEVLTLDFIDAQIADLTAELERRIATEFDGADPDQAAAPSGAPPA